VDEIDSGPASSALPQVIVALAKTLGVQSIAEGIEREAQLAGVRALGCDLAQGYLFAVPMPAESIAAALSRH